MVWRLVPVITTIFLGFLGAMPAAAQEVMPPGPAPVVPPALMVRLAEKSEPLKLAKVKVEALIRGPVAETRMTMTFFNPNHRQMAGDLYFPLPEGATVSGYALDINGVMVDGVVVEKDKGRQVFEKEVRRGIDPGLVEWVKGNNFKTRVFPIPAQGSRTVMVRYLAEVLQDKDGASYFLPLRFQEPVADFSLRVEVVRPQAPPQIKKGELANFAFTQWRDSFVAETSLKNQAHNQDLVIALPETEKQPVLVEKGPDGEYYFCIQDAPPPPPAQAERPAPRHLTVYWDASGSRGKTEHTRELALLKDYLAKTGAKKMTVDLVLFRHEADKPRHFTVEQGDAGPLLEALAQVDYDGGTQLGAISPPKKGKVPDLYLLFTDGLANFGADEPQGFTRPVYIFGADATANHAYLHYLAQKTGGEYFNLTKLTNDAVLPRIGAAPYSFLAAKFDAKEISQTYPATSQPVPGRFLLAGKLLATKAQITLTYGAGGKAAQSRTFDLSREKAAAGNLLRLLYAQKKIEGLEVFPQRHARELLDTGRQYGLVTPGASLIVLERLEQYVTHEIPPPESLPEMRRRYVELVEQKEQQEKQEKQDKLEAMVALWQQRVNWWNQEFKYPKDFKYEQPQSKKRARRAGGFGLGYGAPAPSAAPPAPAPPPMAQREAAPLMTKSMAAPGGGPGAAPAAESEEPLTAIKAWSPDTPYLKVLQKAAPEDYLKVYLEQRRQFAQSPAFFLDCAEFFFQKKQDKLGLRVLSNIAEMEMDNPALLRVLAHKLAQQNHLELSRKVFAEVLEMRPEEPQSYRDLALVLDRLKDYPQAAVLLYKVVLQKWDRFPQIELIALEELNRILAEAQRAGVDTKGCGIDPRLVKLLDLDLRVVLTWDADLTDMDLWVVEPSTERAYYGHPQTTIGGLVSRDVTDGYGPEEYLLRKAMPGTYQIKTNYFASHSPSLTGGVTLQVEIFTNYGRVNEKRQALTLRLSQSKETFTVGEVKF